MSTSNSGRLLSGYFHFFAIKSLIEYLLSSRYQECNEAIAECTRDIFKEAEAGPHGMLGFCGRG